MNSKIRLLAVASMVVIMASGCSSYRGSSQASANPPAGGYSSGSSQTARSGQVAGSGQVARGGGFGQQRSRNAVVNDSCAACAASKAQSTYTYKPATPAPVARAPVARAPAPRPAAQAGQHNQQYYIDRWNRQQAAGQQKPAPRPVQGQSNNTNYAGYGQTGQSNTTYYDYSTAARTNTQAPATNAASNKSIYTGSYQQKTYTPTTYSGGSAATTNTGSAYQQAKANIASNSGGVGSYTVKKGDTVFEIMRQTGVYWKDIISMNSLQPPYNINPGQTLRLK